MVQQFRRFNYEPVRANADQLEYSSIKTALEEIKEANAEQVLQTGQMMQEGIEVSDEDRQAFEAAPVTWRETALYLSRQARANPEVAQKVSEFLNSKMHWSWL